MKNVNKNHIAEFSTMTLILPSAILGQTKLLVQI